jgi:hypothetical protein
MLKSEKHRSRVLNPIDTGIYFEALEPRLLFSGSPEGVAADAISADPDQATQSVVEAENFAYPEVEVTSAFDSLSVIDPLESAESDASDTMAEPTLSEDDPEGIDPDLPSEDPDPLLNIPTATTAAEAIAPEDAVITDNALFDDMPAGTADAADGIADDSLSVETAPGDTLLGDTLLVQAENETDSTGAEIIPTLLTDAAAAAAAPKELVFINDDIRDYDQLTEDLTAQNTDGRDITVVTLDSEQDGIEQISSVLAESEDIDAIHFVSHGTDRSVKLGDAWIDNTNVEDYAPDIAGWGDALAEEADLLFYGCNLAGGDRGRELLETIGELTDADVAASTDNTGSAIYGADWDLEYSAGNIETSVVFSDQIQENWSGLLDTYTVINTDDSGAGSLRQAIIDAEANAGTDTIEFNIAGGGPHEILVGWDFDGLPEITEAVIIDGTTQPGFAGTPVIVLDGFFAGAGADGFLITGDGSTIRGLVIKGFDGDGIDIRGGNNTIAGNYIGTDVNGTADEGNDDDGVDIIGGANNIIGGNTAADRNIISGNTGEGVKIDGAGATGNQVIGNYIGTDVNGTAAIANSGDGIEITNGATGNTIGGTTVGHRNIISGNTGDGIYIAGAATTGNEIQGNYIGIDVNGTADLGNGNDGIELDGAANNTIGGDTAGERNVISGNAYGIYIHEATATGNTIQGNYVGTAADGTSDLGNTNSGFYIEDTGSNTIGGVTSGEGNVIAHNGEDGVTVMGTASGITIRGNSIHSNTARGIDFTNDGVTENDLDDVDAGANDLQNFPVLTSNDTDLSQITISGTMDSVASKTYTIDFYSSSAADGSGNGEGAVYLGSTTCATDVGGDGSFSVTLPASVTVGHFISATATDPDGNTSEFSDNLAAAATNDAPTVTPTGADLAYTEDDGAVAVDDAIAVADVDDTDLESATVQITGNYLDTEDQLGFTNQNGITGIWDVGTGTLTLTGTASVANYQTALQSITYTNRDNAAPDTNTRTVTFTVNDGDTDSVAATRDITVTTLTDITARETIDSDGDGQIDQIKITTDQNLDDDFSGLTMTVAGYGVAGYSTDIANDNIFYVDLTESGTGDTGATPTVTVTANTTLSEDGGANNIAIDDTAAWWDADWQNRTRITFDNSNSAEDLTDFPVLVSLTAADVDFDKIKANGADIRFVDDDNSPLAYEIEDWDDGAETAKVWVKVQQLDQLSNTDYIHMYYNNTAASDAQNAAGVWTAGTGVWHLDDDPGPGGANDIKDSDATPNNGTAEASMTSGDLVTGQIGNGIDFDGGDDFIDFASTDVGDTFTISAWIKPDSTGTSIQTIAANSGSGANTDGFRFFINSSGTEDGRILFETGNGGASNTAKTAVNVINFDEWNHIAVEVDRAGGTATVYHNGVDVTDSNTIRTDFNTVSDWEIGRMEGGLEFKGAIDEFRITSAARSADWIEASCLSQNSTFAYTSFGSGQVTTTDTAAPVLLSAIGTDRGTAGMFNDVGDQLDLVFSEAIQAVPGEADSETNFLFSGIDGDNFPTEVGGDTIIELATTTMANDTIRYTFSAGDTANANLITVGTGTIDVNIGGLVADSIEDAAGNDLSDTSTGLPLTISATNVAPVLDNTGTMALTNVVEDDAGPAGDTVTDIIDSATGNRITDLDGGAVEGVAVIGVDNTNGTWQYNTGGGWADFGALTAANNSAVLLNPAASIRFVPDADYNGTAGDITFRAWDQTSGSNGDTAVDVSTNGTTTAYSTDTETATLTVTAENDKPTVTPTVADLAYTENDGAVALDDAITVADVDNANIKGAAIQITGNYVNGEDTLTFVNQLGITGTWTAATGTLELTGTTTKANYQTALQSITYTNGSANPDTNTRTVTFTVTDEGNLAGDAATRDITVAADNDKPTVTPTVADLSYTENDGAVILDAGITTADTDNINLKGAVIQITGNYQNGEDTLAFVNQNGITGVWDAGTGQLTLTGTATTANYQTALQSITYTNDSEEPDTGDRTVTFTVTDESNLDSDAGTRDITVASVNDIPVADDAVFTVAEDAAGGTVVGTATATDLDINDTQTFSITAGNSDGIFAIDSATGQITIADNTKLDFETASSHNLTVTVTDDGVGALSDTAAVTVNVTNINEIPVADDAAVSVDENSANGTVVGTVAAIDPDVGDTLAYSITAGNSDGIFAIDSATGQITVADNAKLDYETAPSHSLTIQVKDTGDLTDTFTTTVSVTGVNEEPLLTDYAFNIDENTGSGTRLGRISASDPDMGDALIYSIIAGNENSAFRMNAATGEISINNSEALDFETRSRFDLTVRVTDSGALTQTASVTVTLNDVKEKVFWETEPVSPEPGPEPANAAGTDAPDGSDSGENSGKDETGNDGSEGQADISGPVDDRSVGGETQTVESEDTFGDVSRAETAGSLSGVPDFLKLYALDTTSDRTDRESSGDNNGGQGGKKDLKSGAEAGGNEKQAPAVNALASGQGALGSGLKDTDRMSAQAKKMLSNRNIQTQLDALKEQINNKVNLQKGEVKFMVGTAGGVTATAVAGYMLWMFRGVSLIASAIASLPVWQFFDPLPVLSRWEKAGPADGRPGAEAIDDDEKRLDDIFEEKQDSKKEKKKKRDKDKKKRKIRRER